MKPLFKTLNYARNLWPYYVGITIFSILIALMNQLQPLIIKSVTDLVVEVINHKSPNYSLGLWLAVAFFVTDFAVTLFSNWGGYLGDIMTAKLRKQLSERYYTHLLSLPQSYFDNELTGTIINRLNRTIEQVTGFINMFANNFFQMVLTMIFTLIIVVYYSWEVAILLFIIYPLFLWLTTLSSKAWQKYQADKNLHTDIASGRFAEVIAQIKVVKSFIKENHEERHFDRHYQKTVDLTYDQSKLWHRMDIYRRLVLNIIFFVIFGFVFWQTLRGRFTIGEMFLLIQYAMLMRLPIFSMSFIVDSTQRAIAGSIDYFQVMQIKPDIVDKQNAPKLTVDSGRISYHNVTFAYKNNQTILKKISFEIEPDSKVALVGESGEGKTTLTNLLLRMYEPASGYIEIDGQNVHDVQQHSLRENIAVVFQDPALFSGTIRENIAYANPQTSDDKVLAAAKAANADEFISKLPKGYDTEIGERGLKLSGGQKQRIAIARALLKDAPILILDEATSSLDSRAEVQVQEAL
ncbi:MAG TPA: ABC transporter ATP-binding protein, partial [Candidatus Saccharimonadales bacterium]|nr:ABC transporter ATP-binding protein [Candidatus Saccharimonadales bacterium]